MTSYCTCECAEMFHCGAALQLADSFILSNFVFEEVTDEIDLRAYSQFVAVW